MTIKRLLLLITALIGFATGASASCSTVLISSVTSNPPALSAGVLSPITFTMTTGASGLQSGDVVALRVPDYWPQPNISSGNPYGYVASTTQAAFVLNTTTQTVMFVATGTINAGVNLTVTYMGYSCDTSTAGKFRIFFLPTGCIQPTEAFTTNSALVKTIINGPGAYLNFVNYNITAIVNQVTPVPIRITDTCGNVAAATSPIAYAIDLLRSDYTSDSTPAISTNSSMSPLGFTIISSMTIGATAYYRLPSLSETYKRLRLTYTPAGASYQNNQFANITNVGTGLSSSSVDTGITGGLTQVTFTPDQDGTADFVYINFMLPADMSWVVKISNDNTFSSTGTIRQFYGYGANNRISWDGYTDWSATSQPEIAAPGTYFIKIEANGLPSDTSLSAILSAAGIKGVVISSATLLPIDNANVDVYGTANRYVRTKADGSFSAYGLRAGSYSYRISKEGFQNVEQSTTITAGQSLNLGNIKLGQAAVARISVTRSTDSVNNAELWGSVNANTTDWKYNSYGTIHFAVNSTTSDAGDMWNATQTTYTALSLIPGQSYTIKFDIPNLGAGPLVVGPFTGGQVVDISTVATRRANIAGLACVPPTYNVTSNTWFSIEAGIDANNDGTYDSNDPSKRYYAGGNFQSGVTCSSFSIHGVTNGTYTLITRAPLLAPKTSTNAVVTNGQDTFVDVSTLTTGGIASGTITINGDLSSNPNVSGNVLRMPISVWSPTTYIGAWGEAQINVVSSFTVTTGTYLLSGLSNGSYNLWANLPGCEINPPGQKSITVANGSGQLNLVFNQFGGTVSGTITKPGGGAVNIELVPYDFQLQKVSSVTTGGAYSFTQLGTGFYTLRAVYLPTGFIFEKNVQVVNGQTIIMNIVLTGTTYSISGTVRTVAKSPFDSLTYLVNSSTPTTLYNSTASSNQNFPANRIVARRLQVRDDAYNNQGGGGTTAANAGSSTFDPWVMFFGAFDTTGAYSIPNLTPGLYLLTNNGEMDNSSSNGKEISESGSVVSIISSNLTGNDFTLSDGFDISGRLTVDSGTSETGRNFKIILKTAKGDTLNSQLVFLTGTSITFALNRIPAGTYVLTAEDQEYPKKYAAKELAVEVVSASLSNQEIKLLSSAKIQGQLRVKTSGELITSANYSQLLPDNFYIEARSNPWFQGGWGRVDGTLIGSDNNFTTSVSPGTYDIIIKSQSQFTQSQAAEGKKSFVPIKLSGVRMTAGQTTNVGVIDLREGVPVSGTVTDSSGTPLPNIRVIADMGSHNSEDNPEAFTDQLGKYTLLGLDPDGIRFYDIVAAPRPENSDQRFSNNTSAILYGESRKARFDSKQSPLPAVNFRLDLAQGSVSGTVAIPSGSTQPLLMPFDEGTGINLPGAVVIMNKHGDIPQNNPLGNIEEKTNADGTFSIKGLAAGVYDMWVLALNYGGAVKRNITIGNANTDVGTLTVISGFTMSGTLAKADGSPLNSREFDTIVGVRDGFEEIVVGRNNEDASGNITGYSMSGFQSGKTYSILLFGENDDVYVLAQSVTLTGDTVQNFVVGDIRPVILTQASKNQDGSMDVQFEFTQALRNSDADTDNNSLEDDSEWDKIIQLKTGSGSLSHDVADWLTPDRKRILVTYTPAAGETSFVLTASCTFVSLDGTTGLSHAKTQDFTYFLGIGKQRTVRIPNAGGGTAELDEDVSKFQSQPGTFGDDSDLEVSVVFRSADSQTSLASQAPVGVSVMSQAGKLGLKAYPSEMASALQHLQALDVDPFGSFYDIVLPAGVSHFFPEGKEAKICLAYDSTVTDPYALNIYYYNPDTNEYLLENQNKAVDTDNERICASISHASVFTILNSSQSILNGGGYTGDLKVVNFPNPFNLKPKSVTLQDPGSNSASQTTSGTMIKMSIPTGLAGTVEIEIFTVTGQKVRTLTTSVTTGGSHFYTEWDGKNDHGSEVASGVYIGRFTIGGSNEKFFKMAVVK